MVGRKWSRVVGLCVLCTTTPRTTMFQQMVRERDPSTHHISLRYRYYRKQTLDTHMHGAVFAVVHSLGSAILCCCVSNANAHRGTNLSGKSGKFVVTGDVTIYEYKYDKQI